MVFRKIALAVAAFVNLRFVVFCPDAAQNPQICVLLCPSVLWLTGAYCTSTSCHQQFIYEFSDLMFTLRHSTQCEKHASQTSRARSLRCTIRNEASQKPFATLAPYHVDSIASTFAATSLSMTPTCLSVACCTDFSNILN